MASKGAIPRGQRCGKVRVVNDIFTVTVEGGRTSLLAWQSVCEEHDYRGPVYSVWDSAARQLAYHSGMTSVRVRMGSEWLKEHQ